MSNNAITLAAIAKLLLKDKMFGCGEYTSKLSCQISSGNFNLATFGFLDGDPVTTGFILLGQFGGTTQYSFTAVVSLSG